MKKYKLIKEYPGSPLLGTIMEYPQITTHTSSHKEVFTQRDSASIYPEFWEEIIEKDYEILSLSATLENDCHTTGSIYNIKPPSLYHHNSDKYWKIHSIKRLSDSEVFTIGDKVNYNYDKKPRKLLEITLESDKLKLWACEECFSQPIKGGNYGFNELQNINKIKQPLFTTEDSVDIFENDKFFKVWNDTSEGHKNFHWTINETVAHNNVNYKPMQITNKQFHGLLYFSSKEKAEEYIIMNKPCLSLKDVATVYKGINKKTNHPSSQANQLKELVKSKLNE